MASSIDECVVFMLPLGDLSQRPPGSLPEDDFKICCDSCGQCVDVCPNNGLRLDGDGQPILTVEHQTCGRCHLCSDVCTRGALVPPEQSAVKQVKELTSDDIAGLLRAALPGIKAKAAPKL